MSPRLRRILVLSAFSVLGGVLYAGVSAATISLVWQPLGMAAVWLLQVGAVFGLGSALYVVPLLMRSPLRRAMAFVAATTGVAAVVICALTGNPLLVVPFHATLCAMAGRRYAARAGVIGGRCARCGYDLRGLEAGRCPECGAGLSS